MTQKQIRTLSGGTKKLGSDDVDQLRQQLHGELLDRDHPDYEEARALYNAMIDKHPALIARCTDEGDVMTAVNFARENDVLVAVCGGGHNGPGLGSCEGGLVIDLSPMNGVRVDPRARTARVGPGCRWRDVDHATHAHGQATVSGVISTTGVGGLTLGGGHGYLTRQFGLTVDNLLEVDVVLASGERVTASEAEHEDLFWALRGGGGNFGVVTSFLFQTHPVDNVYAGPMFWRLDDARAVLEAYRDFMPAAPRDLYGFFAFMVVPPAAEFPEALHGESVCAILWCHNGTKESGEAKMSQLRQQAPTPAWQHLGMMPYPVLQSMHDELYPPGYNWYWKGAFVQHIPDEAVDIHLDYGSRLPTPLSTMHLYPIDGAVHDHGRHDTAFSYREANWSQVIVGVDPNPDFDEELVDWARGYWEELQPHTLGGAYVNFMMEEGDEQIRATYRDNYNRLISIKRTYDPNNLFRVNQNISPTQTPREAAE